MAHRPAGALSRLLAILVVIGAGMALIGWMLDIPILRSIRPDWPSISPPAAAAFFLAGIGIYSSAASGFDANARALRDLPSVLAIGVLLIGALRLYGVHTQTLMPWESVQVPRISAASAVNFLLAGSALLAIQRAKGVALAQILSVLVILVTWFGFSRFPFGLATQPSSVTMAVPTVVLFILVALGILFLRPEAAWIGRLTGASLGGFVTRGLWPALLVPPLMGWLALEVQERGLLSIQAALIAFSLLGSLLFAGLVGIGALRIERLQRASQEARSALRSEEKRTQLILESALDAVVSIDANGVINGWNARAAQMTGWAASEVMGRTLSETIVPARLRAAHEKGLARHIATGVSHILGARVELTARHRDGHEFPVEIAITRFGDGDALGFCAFVRDVSAQKEAQARLARSEARFQRMADTAPVLLWQLDKSFKCIWFNRQWLEFVGQPMEAEVGDGWLAHVPTEDSARCRVIVEEAAAQRRPFTLEYRLRRHDGALRWVTAQGVPLDDADGAFSGYIGSAIDITDRREALAVLRNSELHFRMLAESLPQLVWTCRPDGWCDYLSRQWLNYTGRTLQEEVGSGWAENVHPEDRPGLQSAWARAVAERTKYDVEFRIRRHDGVYRWFKTRAVPVIDEQGVLVKWVGSNTDFEEVKRAAERQTLQIERMLLLDRIVRAIAERQDLASIFHVVLETLEAHLGIDFACFALYQPNEKRFLVSDCGSRSADIAEKLNLIAGQPLVPSAGGLARCERGELIYEAELAQSNTPLARVLAGGGLHSAIAAPLRRSENLFAILLVAQRTSHAYSSADCEFLRQVAEHVALASEQAELHEKLKLAYDDLRRTQEAMMQQERLRAFGEMASGIAHDLNNALSPAALSVEYLLEMPDAVKGESREVLQNTYAAIGNATETIARLREFYRTRDAAAELIPIDLNRLLEATLSLTRARWRDIPQSRGATIVIERDLATALPLVPGAESEVRDAFTNLILNAVDAMPGGGTLTVRTAAENGTVSVEFVDTGTGMDEVTRSRCIEPFYTTKGEGGTGLGLAMVYGMAERHGAELHIESALGRGTRMRLTFPVHAAPAEGKPKAAIAENPVSSLKLLLVDDDPAVLRTLKSLLRHEGHLVNAFGDGRAALADFVTRSGTSEAYDVVISDLGMPEMDGRQVAAEVKRNDASTPVILLTGWGQSMGAQPNPIAHVDAVLAKPPKLSELRRALSVLIAGRDRQRPNS